MGQASGGTGQDSNRFCLCMAGDINEQRFDAKWIYCEGCKEWFHPDCVLLTETEYDEIIRKNEKWFCSFYMCQQKKITTAECNDIDQNTTNSESKFENSQPNITSSQCLTHCNKCDFIAKNNRGFKVHQRKHEKESSISTGNDNTKPTIECPHCHGYFINLQGHITRKHQEIARKTISKNYDHDKNTTEKLDDNIDNDYII